MLPENHNGKPLKMYEFVEESAAYWWYLLLGYLKDIWVEVLTSQLIISKCVLLSVTNFTENCQIKTEKDIVIQVKWLIALN